MQNNRATVCDRVMQQIDLNSTQLSSQDHIHISRCSSCHSYYMSDCEIMSELKQCLAIKAPRDLKNNILQHLDYSAAHHSESLTTGNQKQNNTFKTELMTCAVCFSLIVSSLMLFVFNTRPVLADSVVEHLQHRHEADYTENVPVNTVRQLLQPYNVDIDNMISEVIFADECVINGQTSVHIIYSMNKQPVSVIAVPTSTSQGEVKQISDQGYQGLIIGLVKGTIVIASKNKRAVSDMYQKLKGTLTAI